MLGITTTNARVGGFRGKGIDADAAAFIAPAGITDATQKAAINTLVVDLKSATLWDKFVALYPFVGGTATTHKFNLKNPLDTDGAFRINWVGGVTHNANGVTGNGVNGYGNLFIKPSVNLLLNDLGFSYLCSNTGIDGGTMFGVQDVSTSDRLFHFPAFNAGNTTQTHINSNLSASTATPRQGFHTLQRTSAINQNNYRNGSLVANTATTSLLRPTRDIYILCYNNAGTASTFNASNIRIFMVHTSLDATQAANLNTIQNKFQTTLSRNV
jgi:hypothetical protein